VEKQEQDSNNKIEMRPNFKKRKRKTVVNKLNGKEA
jgi:hypothetical protein